MGTPGQPEPASLSAAIASEGASSVDPTPPASNAPLSTELGGTPESAAAAEDASWDPTVVVDPLSAPAGEASKPEPVNASPGKLAPLVPHAERRTAADMTPI